MKNPCCLMANEVTISGTPLNPYLSDILEKTGRATVIGNVPEGGIYNIIATKTGTYAPVKEYIDITSTGKLPDSSTLPKGYRIVTKEREQRFGRLYTYDEVQAIKKALVDTGSKWRIPTKEDWDKMLNAIEDDGFRNHNSIGEGYYGNRAAYALKGVDNLWVDGVSDNRDDYGFCVLPLGYADYRAILLNGMDGNKDVEGFGKCAAFWTDTKASPDMEGSPIFAKYFWYGSGKVMQQALAPQSRLSLRLVRNFEVGFDEYEPILGDYYHCGPVYAGDYDNHNASIWTLSNINTVIGGSDFGYISNEWEDTIDSVISFYINEWTGDRWLRHRMHEGDSVVVIGDSDAYNHEWRIYVQDGEEVLLDSVKITSDDILDIVRDNLETLVEESVAPFESRISDNENNISSLSAVSVSQENKIAENRSLIESLSASVISSDEEIMETVSANKAETDSEINRLNADIKDVSGYAISNVERLDADISGLTVTVDSLSSSTVEELTRLDGKDSELSQNISDTNVRVDNALASIGDLSGAVISNIEDIHNTMASNKEETDAALTSLDEKIDTLRDTVIDNEKTTSVALNDLDSRIKALSGYSIDNISNINEKIDSFSGSVIDELALIEDDIDDITQSIDGLSESIRLNYAVSSANTALIKELSAVTEDAIAEIYSSVSAETDERKAEDESIRQDTSRSLSELESRFQDYLSGATIKPEEIEQIKSDILSEVSKMLAGVGVPVYLTETEYNNMVSAGTVNEKTLYYVYEDAEEPVVPEESGTTGDINTDTGVLSLANATVEEDVLVINGGSITDGVLTLGGATSEEPVVPEESGSTIDSGSTGQVDAESGIFSLENASVDGEVLVVDGATIDENGVLDFGYQETGNTETTTTEVSDDGTAIVSDSAVDETTGTLSLNNASVSEDGILTI